MGDGGTSGNNNKAVEKHYSGTSAATHQGNNSNEGAQDGDDDVVTQQEGNEKGAAPKDATVMATAMQERASATGATSDVHVQLEAINKRRCNLLEDLCRINESNLQTEFTTEQWENRLNIFFKDLRRKVLITTANTTTTTNTTEEPKDTLESHPQVNSTASKEE